jgi:hypothetical protein
MKIKHGGGKERNYPAEQGTIQTSALLGWIFNGGKR